MLCPASVGLELEAPRNCPLYNRCVKSEHFDDPVAAYDRLASAYANFALRREPYLRSVEKQVIARIPPKAGSLLDVGAGDGTRAARIAAARGILRIVLVEPSPAMAGLANDSAELWRTRAEELDLDTSSERFDAITCLWNSLGHVCGVAKREQALKAAAQFLSPQGRIFVDVIHRYNARSYGWTATCPRWLRDSVLRDPRTGDVIAAWDVGDSRISTYGHVFTHREMVRLANAAGLEIEERLVIDYDDGSLREMSWQGNLLYILRRSS